MTLSLLFACLGSFWLFQCRTLPIWSSIWFEFNLLWIPFSFQLNNNILKRHGSGSGVRSKQGCIKVGRVGTKSSLGTQSSLISHHSYNVAVLIMFLINYVTHQCINTIQNTPHKTTQTPHKTSSGEGLPISDCPFSCFVSYYMPLKCRFDISPGVTSSWPVGSVGNTRQDILFDSIQYRVIKSFRNCVHVCVSA